MAWLTIRYSVGNEHSPTDPWGRSKLVIHADGRARLDHYFSRGRPPRSWAGQVDAAATDELLAALGQAGFPETPPAGPLPPGSAVRRLTVEADGAAHEAALSWPDASPVPGYAAAFDIIDAVIRQLSRDTVRYPTKRGPVVHDAVAVPVQRAESETGSDVPLTRLEAVRPAEDALDAQAGSQATRLLEVAPAVQPATGPDGAAIDDFARRYAASRGLTSPGERGPAWREPGPWFLATLNISRSHGLMAGGVSDGPAAEVWYAQSARQGRLRDRSRGYWIVARYVLTRAHPTGGIAVAVRRGRGLARGGPARGLTQVPRGLTEVAADGRLAERYVVAASGWNLTGRERSWADRLLTDDFASWLLSQPYGGRGAEATCFQVQGDLLCVYAAGWPQTADALDAFRERADHIASAVDFATR